MCYMCTHLSLQAGRTPIELAPDSALADLFNALHLEEDSSTSQSMPSYI